jgi:quercetin dioxygenase-like cupin family protein
MQRIVGRRGEIAAFAMEKVEGVPIRGQVSGKKMLHGQNALLAEVRMRKGTITPPHHHGHESYLYIVSGRVRTTVGGEAYELGPGDAVLHAAGVSHICEAIEDAVWIEVKAPAEEPW